MPTYAYRHKYFANKDIFRCYGTDQCWLDEVGNFGTAEAPDFRCIFHAPANLESIDRPEWPLAERGPCQAERLEALLAEWNAVNAKRRAKNKKSLAFVLPGLSCGELNLTRFVFSGDFICTDATFTGDAEFEQATFSGNAEFDSVTFTGKAEFDSATFTELATFDSAMFTGDAGFELATFIEEDWFESATFTEDAWFKSATFSGTADFEQLTSMGQLFLQNCHFANSTSFTWCQIHDLSYATHTGERVVFNQCKTLHESNKPSGYWDFANQDCSLLSFLNMDLSKANFLGANLNDTHFDSCTWPGEPYEYAKVYYHDDILSHADRSQLSLLNVLYQQLKKNLEDARNYRQAGDFHYREMEVWQRLLQMEGLSLDRAILWLYRFVGDFGENYRKLFASLVLSILLVTGLVTVSESLLNGNGIATLTDLFSVFPERFHDGQLGVTLLDLATRLFSAFCNRFQEVFLGLIPSPFQKNAFDSHSYHFLSKFLIVIEGLFLVTLSVLFVMAMRRRFRR